MIEVTKNNLTETISDKHFNVIYERIIYERKVGKIAHRHVVLMTNYSYLLTIGFKCLPLNLLRYQYLETDTDL